MIVSVRMRGEASADKLMEEMGWELRFSPHARGSVGRPAAAARNAAHQAAVSVRMRGEASADPWGAQ